MTRSLLETVVRQAEALTSEAGCSDAELLRRFHADRDGAAFAELVRRHGPMVWAVCRQMLPHTADAEDAFQATFLALVRSAGTVRQGAVVGGWLHGVAVRVATKARRAAVRRKQREERVACTEAGQPVADAAWDGLMAAVHEEVQRLPDTQRTAFVLCDLEGVPQPAAATRLGWKPGTLTGRLCQARQTLLGRLAGRGFVPAVGAVGVGAASAGAGVPPGLLNKVVTYLSATNDVPIPVLELLKEVTPMSFSRTKLLAAAVLVAGGLATGVGARFLSTAEAQPPTPRPGGVGAGGAGLPGAPGGEGGGAGGLGGLPGGPPGAGGGAYPGFPGGGSFPGGMPGGAGGAYGSASGFSGFPSPRWEYKYEDKPLSQASFMKLVNDLGAQGWEFASVVDVQREQRTPGVGPGAPSVQMIVFKRPVPSSGGSGSGGVMRGSMSGSGVAPPEVAAELNFMKLAQLSGGTDRIDLEKLPAGERDHFNQGLGRMGSASRLPEKGSLSREEFRKWYLSAVDSARSNRTATGSSGGSTAGGPPTGAPGSFGGYGSGGVGGPPGTSSNAAGGGFNPLGVPGTTPRPADPKGEFQLQLLRLKYASANKITDMVIQVFSADKTLSLRVVADDQTNSLLVYGTAKDIELVKKLVDVVDVDPQTAPKAKPKP